MLTSVMLTVSKSSRAPFNIKLGVVPSYGLIYFELLFELGPLRAKAQFSPELVSWNWFEIIEWQRRGLF